MDESTELEACRQLLERRTNEVRELRRQLAEKHEAFASVDIALMGAQNDLDAVLAANRQLAIELAVAAERIRVLEGGGA